jgi:hypothetical protein
MRGYIAFSPLVLRQMNCHSERSEESPHFVRGATLYIIGENA